MLAPIICVFPIGKAHPRIRRPGHSPRVEQFSFPTKLNLNRHGKSFQRSDGLSVVERRHTRIDNREHSCATPHCHRDEAFAKFIDRFTASRKAQMHYDKYRQHGMQIGSGDVENAGRQIVGLRMKRPGSHRSQCRAGDHVPPHEPKVGRLPPLASSTGRDRLKQRDWDASDGSKSLDLRQDALIAAGPDEDQI